MAGCMQRIGDMFYATILTYKLRTNSNTCQFDIAKPEMEELFVTNTF